MYIFLGFFLSLLGGGVNGVTDQNDFKILNDFRNGLKNPELLKWPVRGNDPCGPPSWPHVFCFKNRVTQIQVQGLGLQGPLPQNLNQLDKLQNLGLQKNKFNGNLPTFSGLSDLQFAYLDFNEFDTIPADFFHGLSNIRVLALDENPFNQSNGWIIPSELAESFQLVNFSCSGCNIVGPLPDFFGKFPSLVSLRLSYNRLSGNIPSTFRDSMLQVLWLNDQEGDGMNGPIDVIGTMVGLTSVWLHGNQFTGSIPDDIGRLTSLKELNLNRNRLVGLIPISLANMNLRLLNLNNNMFMGPIPKFKAGNVSYASNSFCHSDPGEQCAPEVTVLLDFLHDLNYPDRLASEWSGNDPCQEPWWGISCNARNEVSVINLQRLGLNGTLSPSLVNLPSLLEIHLEGNNLHGTVPSNLTRLSVLRLLNLSGNNFEPPLPRFRDGVKVVIDGNAKFQAKGPSPVSTPSPSNSPEMTPNNPSSGEYQPSDLPSSGNSKPNSPNSPISVNTLSPTKPRVLVIAAAAAGSTVSTLLAVVLAVYCLRKRKRTKNHPAGFVIHPKDSSGHDNTLKIAVVNGSPLEARTSNGGMENAHVIEAGNLLISLQVLRKVTKDFAQENELGRGGFGVVYKGELEDGGSSRHLFRWKSLGLEPLSWTKRISIALDVARGVEYLHTLAHQSFIHRDLKSANILLDDDFRAKVSDFGLVKLAPGRDMSVATRLAGTFGYLAPEYAVTGKITTKVDVFSFGVVLMELLTGLVALDEHRPEENRYLVEWFWQIKSNKESLIASIDPALDAKEDIYETIYSIATLAGHCTARDPNHRPEMGHAVNVLAQLVEKWKPYEETDRFSGINMTLPLPQMLKGWQDEEEMDMQDFSQDSKGSIPAKPSGFADSFTSADAR
ncbi:hypothetical protein DH2020_027783 [Rehmannia glutinosa]|uniref:Protein kinase domain-containing protein n=1 Tax=Rehmannia glutinosa TaxID=99300 RepID=A0ABR0VT61_REHGL